MPLPNNMGFELTPAEVNTIKLNLKSIRDILGTYANINLTPEERRKSRAVAEGRSPYIGKTYTVLGPGNPLLHPPYLPFATAVINYNYSSQLDAIIIETQQTLEILEDHKYSADNLNYRWMLKFYNNAQEASDTDLPGVDTVLNELSPLFALTNDGPDAPDTEPEDTQP